MLWIRDLNSKNGTFVNGVRIRDEVPLAANDLVQIADTPFRLTRESKSNESTLAADHDQGALALVQLMRLLQTQEIHARLPADRRPGRPARSSRSRPWPAAGCSDSKRRPRSSAPPHTWGWKPTSAT